MKSRRIHAKAELVLMLFIILATVVHGIQLRSLDQEQSEIEETAMAMAYSEMATLDPKDRDALKKQVAKEEQQAADKASVGQMPLTSADQLSEGEAIAAFQEQNMKQNGIDMKDAPQEDKKKVQKKMVKAKPKVAAKPVEKPREKSAFEKSLPEADIDMSSIDTASGPEGSQNGGDAEPVDKSTDQPNDAAAVETAATTETNTPDDASQKQPQDIAVNATETDTSNGSEQAPAQDKAAETEASSNVTQSQPEQKVEEPRPADDMTIQEAVNEKEKLSVQVYKDQKVQKAKQEELKQKKQVEQQENSMWGQLDTMVEFSRDQVSKAQGYEEPGIEPVNLEPAPEKPSDEVLEKQSEERLKLFSEFVAAESEAKSPVIKEQPKEAPLHFKYYKNEGEDDTSLPENVTDDLLGVAQAAIEKQQLKLPYADAAYDKEIGVTPAKAVDYTQTSKLDVPKLMEPLDLVEVSDISTAAKAPVSKKDEKEVDLITS